MREKSNKIRPTLSGKVARVPMIMQLETLECGAASLAMVMAYYGKWVPLEQVRLDCGVSRDGSRAKNIYIAAEHYGMDVKAYRMSAENLRKEGKFPCIIYWNMNHFVVLKGFKGKKAYINNPARGFEVIVWEEFERSYSGVVLIPVPSERFETGGKKKSVFNFTRKRLAGTGAAIAFVMLTTAMSYLFGIANSVSARIFVDRILNISAAGWLGGFIAFVSVLAVMQIVVAWIQAIYSMKINGKLAVIGSTSFMWKILHLPMEFFSQRLAGDIQSRLLLNSTIAGTLVQTFAPLVINTFMMVVYLAFMLSQSVLLTAVGLAALALNIIMARIISKHRINITRVQLRDQGKLEAATVAGISMIETIKASGAERGFFQKWAGYQASVNNAEVHTERTNQLLGAIPEFLTAFVNYAVLMLGVYLVIQNKITLGAVLMFQGLLGSFMTPADSMIGAGQNLQEMQTQMERVEDVMEYPDDPDSDDNEDSDTDIEKLEGNVELRNVSFGYSRLEEPIIRDLSFSLKKGQSLAIVGASGCGKSTVAKLIGGLYQPQSGEILFDGRKREDYPREVLINSVAVVDQDITLFEETVAENIRMCDRTIPDEDVVKAAKDAQLHEEILRLHGAYQYKLVNGGKNLSGGQRQRMEIARALATDPKILVLDEATSALDAKTEQQLVDAIEARNITCIVIAHRLSTVRRCDEIIVLDHGRICERGTHRELMDLGGTYAELIKSERTIS